MTNHDTTVREKQTGCPTGEVPNLDGQRRREEAERLQLAWQVHHQDYLSRKHIAASGGYENISLAEAASRLTGQSFRRQRVLGDWTRRMPFKCEWPRFKSLWRWTNVSDLDEPLEWCRYGDGFHLARREITTGAWWQPQRVIVTRLDSLRTEIPYGVMLKVSEARDSGMFDCFSVLAPAELVQRIPTRLLDPIVVGSIYDLQYESADADDYGGETHFMIAQWI